MAAAAVASAATISTNESTRRRCAISAVVSVTELTAVSRRPTSSRMRSTPLIGRCTSADCTSTPMSRRSSRSRESSPESSAACTRRTPSSNSATNGGEPVRPATADSISGLADTRSGSEGRMTRSVISRLSTLRTSGSASAAAARSEKWRSDSSS